MITDHSSQQERKWIISVAVVIIGSPTISPNLTGLPRLQIPHLHHRRRKSLEELSLVAAEPLHPRPRLVPRVQRLIGVQKPPPGHEIPEILIVEHQRRRVQRTRHVLVDSLGTQPGQLGPETRIHFRIGYLPSVQPEHDREAPTLADGVGPGERHQVGGGEAESPEQGQE